MSTEVNREAGAKAVNQHGPDWVVLAKLAPCEQFESYTLSTAQGSLTSQMMKILGPRFPSFAGKQPAVVTGMEPLGDDVRLVADPENRIAHAQKLLKVTQRLTPESAAELKEIVKGTTSCGDGADPAVLKPWMNRVRKLSEQITAVSGVLSSTAGAAVFTEQAQILSQLLFHDLPQLETGALVLRAESHLAMTTGSVVVRGEAMRAETAEYAPSWAGLSLLELNAMGCLPDRITFINCSDPEELLASRHGWFVEWMEGRDAASVNIVVAEPIRDLASLSSIQAYFGERPRLLGGLYVSFTGYDDIDDLMNIAAATPPVATVGAGSVWCYAGKARHLKLPTGVACAVAGARMRWDARLQPGVRGAYGILTPSFGSQPNKAIYGLNDLDTIDVNRERQPLAKAALNLLCRNRQGFVSPYSARTRSSLPDYMHIDPVRFQTSGIGEAKHFLEDDFIGDLCDDTIRRLACAETYRNVFGRYEGIPGIGVSIVPGTSGQASTFALSINATWADPITSLKLNFARSFSLKK